MLVTALIIQKKPLFIFINSIIMRYFSLLLLLQLCFLLSTAQTPAQKNVSAEMKAQVEEMKKEIAQLEADLKKAEKEDPEEAKMLRTQLNAMKNMLAMFEKPTGGPAATKSPVKTPIKKEIAVMSPVVPLVLKQPVVIPTAAQAKDWFFWYKGKKINDSTLVTQKGIIVQYKKKKLQLVVQPEKKTDTLFMMAAAEITKNEERKMALVKTIEARKNGFMLYPQVDRTMSVYDDLAKRFATQVGNTFNFQAPPTSLTGMLSEGLLEGLALHGPNTNSMESTEEYASADLLNWILQQLEQARRKAAALPPLSDFPAPPRRDLTLCASCDKDIIRRQYEADSIWIDAYQGKEAEVTQQVMNAVHAYQLNGFEDSSAFVHEAFNDLSFKMLDRMLKKDRILMDRYGKNLEYLTVMAQVVLGHERQLQLLGMGENGYTSSVATEILSKQIEVYQQYYKEQVGLKNHDFVLNLPFHLGIERMLQLLGDEGLGLNKVLEDYIAYNRFAMTLEIDFSWEKKTDEGELDIRATGNLASKDKTYTMLVVDSCGYRLIPYQTVDLTNMVYSDVTIAMQVNKGEKTIRDEQGKLKTIPYSGPAAFNINMPKSRIEFCNNRVPDTLFLSGFSGDESVAAQAAAGLEAIRTKYTVDMGAYASLVFYTEEGKDPSDDAMDVAENMMKSIGGAMQQATPGDLLGKMKMQYEGFLHTEDQQKALQKAISTQKATLLFTANNRSTVLADQFSDTKRKLDDGAELTRGMTHLRIVHDPLK